MPDEVERPAKATSHDHRPRRGATVDLALQIVGRFGNLILGVFVTVLVARSLGDSGFGDWSTLVALLSLTGAFCDLGLAPVAVRRAAQDPDAEPEWLGALIQLRFLLSVGATAVCVGAVLAVSTSTDMAVAGGILAATLLLSAPSALQSIFQLRIRNTLSVAAMSLQSVLWGLGAVIVFETGSGITGLAIAFATVAVIVTVVQGVAALRLGTVRFGESKARRKEMLRVGVPIAITSALVLGYGRIDQVLVLEFGGSHEAGLYAAVYRMFDQAQFVAISVSATVLPLLAAAYASEPARLKAIIQNATEVMLLFAIGGFVISLVYARDIVLLLFGPSFKDAGPALPILIGTLIPVSLGYMLGILIMLTNNQLRYVSVAVVGLIFNVVGNLIAIPIWGFMAAAWITLATEIVVVSLGWAMVRGRLPITLDLGRVPRIAAAATVLFGILVGFRLLSMPVLLAAPIAAVAYGGVLFAVKGVTLTELRRLGW